MAQGRYKVDYGFSDIRKSFFLTRKPTSVTFQQYSDFVKEVNLALIQFVIEGGILTMPHGLGKILIEKYKPTYRVKVTENGKFIPRNHLVDFNETKILRKQLQPTWTNEDWKKVPLEDRPFVMHTNEHSQGFSYRITWDRRNMNGNIRLFEFKANHLSFKKPLVKILKSDNRPSYYDKH